MEELRVDNHPPTSGATAAEAASVRQAQVPDRQPDGQAPERPSVTRAALAELIGTAILVYVGTATATALVLSPQNPPWNTLAVVLSFGLALVALVAALGHVSGCHLNPAVTIGIAASGKFPWSAVPAYVGAQLAGGVLGALATWATHGDAARSVAKLAATVPSNGVGNGRALLIEGLVTFVLVFVVAALATDDRSYSADAPIAIGFALAAAIFVAGPLTGGAVNPARAIGPMLVSGTFTSMWVYIIGPVLGGVLAGQVYHRLFATTAPPT